MNIRKGMIFAGVVVALLTPLSSWATVRNVPAPYTTIQAGINASVNGDTVLVAAGTYQQNINFQGKSITVKGQAGRDSTIIQKQFDGIPVVIFENGEGRSSVISGFTIRNSTKSGVFCGNSSPTINDCIIENNAGMKDGTTYYGGGITVRGSANPKIRKNIIRNNTANTSGATLGGAILVNDANASIDSNIIYGNHSAYGGAIDGHGGTFSLIGNVIYDNYGTSGGGAIFCASLNNVNIINNTIDDNFSSGPSGAVVLGSCSNFNIKNNIISNNRSYGILVNSSSLIHYLYNCSYMNLTGPYSGIVPEIGNKEVDPAFTSQPSRAYSLLSSSPCIDAGDPLSPRDPDSTLADIGAYYYQQSQRTLWNVSVSGSDLSGNGTVLNPFQTIQHGIDVAEDGDTVLAADGHYYERINFLGKAITVASRHLLDGDTAHISNTIIDGDTLVLGVADTGCVVRFLNGEDSSSVLYGFRLQKGSVQGGIFLVGSNPSIRNCIIVNNSRGAYLSQGAVLRADSCILDSGQVINFAVFNSSSDVILTNSTIIHSDLIMCYSGDVYISDSKVYNSRIEGFFAMVLIGDSLHDSYVKTIDWGPLQVKRCSFIGSTIDVTSSLAYVDSSYIENKIVGGGAGGASIELSNSILKNGIEHPYSVTINNSLLIGGTIYFDEEANLNNSIIVSAGTSCLKSLGNDAELHINCSDFYGFGDSSWLSGNLSVLDTSNLYFLDPQFCDTSGNNYSIRSNSICAPANNACNALIGLENVDCSVISDFHLLEPSIDSVYIETPARLVWSSAYDYYYNDTATYRFYIDDTPDFSSADSSDILTDTTYSLPFTLTRSTRYYWKVAAYANHAPAKFSTETGNFYVDGFPTTPTVINPVNGRSVDSSSIFSWLTGSDPDPLDTISYSIQIDDDIMFASPEISQADIKPAVKGDTVKITLDSLTGFPNLTPNAIYYWRVRSDDKFGLHSSWVDSARTFIFLAQISEFTLISPDSGSIITISQPILNWHKATHVDSSVSIFYKIYWDTDLVFDSADSSGVLIDSTYQLAMPLARSHRYYWRVKAFGQRAAARNSGLWEFSLDGIPTSPVIINPSIGAFVDSLTYLTWLEGTDPDSFDMVSYEIQIDEDSLFGTPEILDTIPSGLILDNSVSVRIRQLQDYTNLQNDSKYYWRVRSLDNYGLTSPWPDTLHWFVYNHLNHPPNAPTSGFSPANYEEVISLNPTITWNNASDPDPDDNPGTLQYILRLFSDTSTGCGYEYWDTTEAGVNQIVVADTMPDNCLLIYFVQTIDDEGLASGWSPMQHFWTNHYNYPPEPFPLYSPDNDLRHVAAHITFTWGRTADYDPLASYTYAFRYSSDSLFATNTRVIYGLTDTFLTMLTDTIVTVDYIIYWGSVAIDNDSLVRIGGIPEQTRKVTIFPPGDANGDFSVLGSDVTYLVRFFKGLGNPPDPFFAGDANGDCQLQGSDVTFLVRYFKSIGPAPERRDCE